MGSEHGDGRPHLPPPTIWPVGFAVGVACLLVGLIVSWPVVAVGGAIALLFGFLWVRDVTAEYRRPAAEAEPAPAPAPAAREAEPERFSRSVFLEGSTLGLGAVVGGIVTLPSLGFAILPSFLDVETHDADLGPLEEFPEGQFVLATFLSEPEQGEVSRRTAFVRNNGLLNGVPSFTILSNRCTHLGCPSQPNGPVFEEQQKVVATKAGEVLLIPTQPAGFGCPCHASAFDTEGNRTAGPAVRALDRYEFKVQNGRLVLGKTFSVGRVEGEGRSARIRRYKLAGPGEHVDDWEAWLYPIQAPH